MDSFFVNNRTAKDVLEEFCPKKNYEKTFETTQLQLNPLIFRTFCTIDKGHGIKVFGEGIGGSKTEAEDNVSLKLLPEIMSGGELMAFTVPWNHVISQENQWGKLLIKNEQPAGRLRGGEVEISPTITETTETALSEIFGDPIGRLITTLQRMKAAPATYQIDESPGPGNQKIFTVTCTVGSIIETVRATRKKDGQKIAAHKVLCKLEAEGTRLASRPTSPSPSLSQSTPSTTPPRGHSPPPPYEDRSLNFTNLRLNFNDCNYRPRVPK